MEINSVNNAQSFTGFKITNKTRQGAAKLIEDLTSNFVDKERRADLFRKHQAEVCERLKEEVIEPLKKVKAEVEYNDGRIFVRNADGTRTVELDRGKVAPLHPQEYTVVQYPIKGEEVCIKADYGTRDEARKMAENIQFQGPFSDLLKAREIARHFDNIDAKKLVSETARTEYQKGLDSLADNLLGSLD